MSIADDRAGVRHVFLRDLVLAASIGIYPHEHGAPQRVRINIDLGVTEDRTRHSDRLEHVLDYERVANQVREEVGRQHVNLVETLAERIASVCLADPRVVMAKIRVEKLDVFADMAAVGVEIERLRPTRHPPQKESG